MAPWASLCQNITSASTSMPATVTSAATANHGNGDPLFGLSTISAAATPGGLQEAEVWGAHPSRVDVHGMATCPRCSSPAPAGEMARWGYCSFCRQKQLALAARPTG